MVQNNKSKFNDFCNFILKKTKTDKKSVLISYFSLFLSVLSVNNVNSNKNICLKLSKVINFYISQHFNEMHAKP